MACAIMYWQVCVHLQGRSCFCVSVSVCGLRSPRIQYELSNFEALVLWYSHIHAILAPVHALLPKGLTVCAIECRDEFLEEWKHSDARERQHWGNESLQYMLVQVGRVFIDYSEAIVIFMLVLVVEVCF